jgi:hypothetical protein
MYLAVIDGYHHGHYRILTGHRCQSVGPRIVARLHVFVVNTGCTMYMHS